MIINCIELQSPKAFIQVGEDYISINGVILPIPDYWSYGMNEVGDTLNRWCITVRHPQEKGGEDIRTLLCFEDPCKGNMFLSELTKLVTEAKGTEDNISTYLLQSLDLALNAYEDAVKSAKDKLEKVLEGEFGYTGVGSYYVHPTYEKVALKHLNTTDLHLNIQGILQELEVQELPSWGLIPRPKC